MSFTFRWVSTPGQNNNFVNGSINGGRARAFLDDGKVDPFDSPLYICIPPITFIGGNAGAATLYDFAKLLATCGPRSTVQNPGIDYRGNRIRTGGQLTINDNPCGNYEFNLLEDGTTLSQASVATLFSNTNDISTWIVCKGDLTINSSTVLIPTVNPSYTLPSTSTYEYPPDPDAKRRLFMVLYVKGNLIFSNSSSGISMSACGGNTSEAGVNIASFTVPVASSLFYNSYANSGVSLTSVGGVGGSPAAGGSDVNSGTPGTNGAIDLTGTTIQTGGGGSGNVIGREVSVFSGAGGDGSPFSGGAGGGSANIDERSSATAGSSLGGAGGNGNNPLSSTSTCGGTGNPGGTATNGATGLIGTGGVVIVICEGTIDSQGGGFIRANGVNSSEFINTNFEVASGGASGGGSIVVVQSSSLSTFPTLQALGGTGGGGTGGGRGGNGVSATYGINS
jgi:hypothetical protein